MNWLRDDPLTAILAYIVLILSIVLGVSIVMMIRTA